MQIYKLIPPFPSDFTRAVPAFTDIGRKIRRRTFRRKKRLLSSLSRRRYSKIPDAALEKANPKKCTTVVGSRANKSTIATIAFEMSPEDERIVLACASDKAHPTELSATRSVQTCVQRISYRSVAYCCLFAAVRRRLTGHCFARSEAEIVL